MQICLRQVACLSTLVIAFIHFCSPSFLYGAVTTNVSAGMKIGYGPENTTDVIATEADPVAASVELKGEETSGFVKSEWEFANIADASGVLNFNYSVSASGGNGLVLPTFLGIAGPDLNWGKVEYTALSDSTATLNWNFSQWNTSSTALFLELSKRTSNGNVYSIAQWDDLAYKNGTTGSSSFSVTNGYTYILKASAGSGISGGLSSVDNKLAGSINFNFSPSPVPIPSTVLLFGAALIGIGGLRRKKIPK